MQATRITFSELRARSALKATTHTVSTVISDDLRATLGLNFSKAIKGYHLLHDEPVKESMWEDINAEILTTSGCDVSSKSSGSHKSGKDITCSLGTFSNKSAKYGIGGNNFSISSYRLTTVCSDKTPGKIEDIKAEINKRKNFTHYSIIVREEVGDEILYEWYLIPCDYPVFNPDSYEWEHTLGKTGKNKDAITGWNTNLLNGSMMKITFSMSSQLWITVIVTEDMAQFVIGSCRVKVGKKYSYITLYEKESSSD